MGLDIAAVEARESLDQREAETETALAPILGTVDMGEHLEDLRKYVGSDAEPRVLDPEDDLSIVEGRRQPDLPSRLGVLGGITEEIDEDLSKSSRVGVQ